MEEQKKLGIFRVFENVVEAYEKDWIHPDLYLEMKANEIRKEYVWLKW